jgi:hypothetical protein
MTVEKLIARLVRMPPGARVVVHAYEGGFDEAEVVRLVPVKPVAATRWTGALDDAREGDPEKSLAVLIEWGSP